jgi:hypothetical protein
VGNTFDREPSCISSSTAFSPVGRSGVWRRRCLEGRKQMTWVRILVSKQLQWKFGESLLSVITLKGDIS